MKIQRENFNFEVIDHEFWKDTAWEKFTYQCIHQFSSLDKTFIDIGAWIGPISLVAAKLNKVCYSFEPDSVSFAQLTANIKLNNIENIYSYNIAITNRSRVLTMGNDETMGTSNTRINSIYNTFQVEGKSLNEFMSQNKISKDNISMVKLDVEGAEIEILTDEFFNIYTGPLHLSIHVPFYINQIENIQSIKKFITKYSHVVSDNEYLSKDLNRMDNFNGFYSLMLYN